MTLPPLADPAELARWTDRADTDQAVLDALEVASSRFRNAVRHPVTAVVDDEIWLDGNGSTVVMLPAAPISGVKVVALLGVEVTDYTWSRKGMLRRALGWPDEFNAIRVVYTHGYATVPTEIADVVVQEARYLLDLQPGVASMTVGGESVTYVTTAATTPSAWLAAVENFRLNHGDQP